MGHTMADHCLFFFVGCEVPGEELQHSRIESPELRRNVHCLQCHSDPPPRLEEHVCVCAKNRIALLIVKQLGFVRKEGASLRMTKGNVCNMLAWKKEGLACLILLCANLAPNSLVALHVEYTACINISRESLLPLLSQTHRYREEARKIPPRY